MEDIKDIAFLNETINKLVRENEDLIEVGEDYLQCFIIACDLLNDLVPADDGVDWYTVIVNDFIEAKKKSYS